MKAFGVVTLLSMIALAASLTAQARAGEAGAKKIIDVAFETSLEKLFPSDTELARQLPKTGLISLAANEYEACQAVVIAGCDLKGVRVTVGDLATKGGARIGDFNVSVNPVGYVPMIKPFYTPYYIRRARQSKWPDPLLPDGAVDVEAGTIAPFWITVYAPAGTSPGYYTGTVTVYAEGMKLMSAELRVRVWDFALPDESHLRTAFWLYGDVLLNYYGIKSKDDPAYAAMLAKYDDDMLAHRMSNIEIGINRPAPQVAIEPGKEPDFSQWDKWMQGWFAKGQNFFAVPILREDSKETIIAKSRAWGKHLKEKGWLDRSCVFLYDETYDGENQRAWVHEGDKDLRNALTEVPLAKYPSVDVWIPQMERGYEAFPNEIKWARENGKTLWMYTSSPESGPEGTNFYPNTNIDFPATHCRLMPWVCWQDKLDGYLYWCVNNWDKNPWETAETYRNQNGNGSFYYPGKDGPVHSLRIEAFRDGMEDYEYFCLLKSRADAARNDKSKADVVAEADKALSLWDNPKDFMYSVNRHPEMVYERRDKVAELIEMLGK
jgi:hypothetical protein